MFFYFYSNHNRTTYNLHYLFTTHWWKIYSHVGESKIVLCLFRFIFNIEPVYYFFNKTTVLLLSCEESQYDIIIMDLCITIFFLRNYVFMSILIKDRRSKKKFWLIYILAQTQLHRKKLSTATKSLKAKQSLKYHTFHIYNVFLKLDLNDCERRWMSGNVKAQNYALYATVLWLDKMDKNIALTFFLPKGTLWPQILFMFEFKCKFKISKLK